MIEKIILDYLGEHLSVPVSLEVPEGVKRYVVIEKTGSSIENHIKTATIAIQSYAESLFETAILNETVKEVMAGIEELNAISECRLNSDYNFTNTETKQYRYQAVFNITHY